MLGSFVSLANFSAPPVDSEGNSLAGERLRQIIRDRYQISKHSNITYFELGYVTPIEFDILKEIIHEDLEQQQQALKEARGEVELE